MDAPWGPANSLVTTDDCPPFPDLGELNNSLNAALKEDTNCNTALVPAPPPYNRHRELGTYATLPSAHKYTRPSANPIRQPVITTAPPQTVPDLSPNSYCDPSDTESTISLDLISNSSLGSAGQGSITSADTVNSNLNNRNLIPFIQPVFHPFPEIRPLQPIVLNPIGQQMIENMNDNWKRMEDNMLEMHRRMQAQFQSMSLPSLPPPPRIEDLAAGGMTTLPRMHFPKFPPEGTVVPTDGSSASSSTSSGVYVTGPTQHMLTNNGYNNNNNAVSNAGYNYSISSGQDSPTPSLSSVTSSGYHSPNSNGQTPTPSSSAFDQASMSSQDRSTLGHADRCLVGSVDRPSMGMHDRSQVSAVNQVHVDTRAQNAYDIYDTPMGQATYTQDGTLTRGQTGTLSRVPLGPVSHAQVSTLTRPQKGTLDRAQMGTVAHAHVGPRDSAQVAHVNHAPMGTVAHAHVGVRDSAPVAAGTHVRVSTPSNMSSYAPSATQNRVTVDVHNPPPNWQDSTQVGMTSNGPGVNMDRSTVNIGDYSQSRGSPEYATVGTHGTIDRATPVGTMDRSTMRQQVPSNMGTIDRSSTMGTLDRSNTGNQVPFGTFDRPSPITVGPVGNYGPPMFSTLDRPSPVTVASMGSYAPSSVGTLDRSSPMSTLDRSTMGSSMAGTLERDPFKNCITQDNDGKNKFQMRFDMQDFKPGEISVKKDKNRVEVHAHHEEKQPDRISCRVFHQKYELPKDVRLTKLNHSVTPDGVLTVEAPVKPRHRVKFAENGQHIQEYYPTI